MAVNPASRSAYLAVSRGRGPDAIPVLVRVKSDGQPEVVALDKVKFSRGELPTRRWTALWARATGRAIRAGIDHGHCVF